MKTNKPQIYIPDLPLKDKDILQFAPMVKKIAIRTCKKMNPLQFFGLNESSKHQVLNILGQTYEDIYQELLIEVPHAIVSFIKETKKTYKPEYDGYFEWAFQAYVKKSLQRRSSKLISAMWVEKQGQAKNHVTGVETDIYFAGRSRREIDETK